MSNLKSRLLLSKLKPGIYFVTGKGGVGKSFVSSFLGHKHKSGFACSVVRLSSEWGQSGPLLDPTLKNQQWDLQQNIQRFLEKSDGSIIRGFLNRGLKTLSKSSVFQSFLDVVPGLYEVSILGRVLHQWQQDPNQYIFVDSFSSGHFLQMLRTPIRFKGLPISGVIKKDVENVVENLLTNDQLNVISVVNPEFVIMQETDELKKDLLGINPRASMYYVLNKVFVESSSYKSEDLNRLAGFRREMTDKMLSRFEENVNLVIPEIPDLMMSSWSDLLSKASDG